MECIGIVMWAMEAKASGCPSEMTSCKPARMASLPQVCSDGCPLPCGLPLQTIVILLEHVNRANVGVQIATDIQVLPLQ